MSDVFNLNLNGQQSLLFVLLLWQTDEHNVLLYKIGPLFTSEIQGTSL